MKWIIFFILNFISFLSFSQNSDKKEEKQEEKQEKKHKTEGWACIYSKHLHGGRTASGERFDKNKLTAAHLHYKLGTRVKVTNLKNKKSVIVKINDRGPYSKKFIIDLSPAAAKKIGFGYGEGIAKVSIEKVD